MRCVEYSTIKPMSFKKLARKMKEGNCELCMARLTNKENVNVRTLNSDVECNELVNEFVDFFGKNYQKNPDHREEWIPNLRPGETHPPVRPVIRLSPRELKELKKKLGE